MAQTKYIATLKKSVNELKTLRNSALVSLAEAFGQSGDAGKRYAIDTAARLDASTGVQSDVVLLAPRLYAIVARMGELGAQLADKGTREMTNPNPSPTPSRSP